MRARASGVLSLTLAMMQTMHIRESRRRGEGKIDWIGHALPIALIGALPALIAIGCGAPPEEVESAPVAAHQPPPVPAASGEEPRPTAEVVEAVPVQKPSVDGCSGEVRGFAMSFRSGTIARRYSYTLEGEVRSGSVRARYRHSAMTLERGAGNIVLEWSERLPPEHEQGLRELVEGGVVMIDRDDPHRRRSTGGSRRVLTISHAGGCEESGQPPAGWEGLAASVHSLAREALPRDAFGELALGRQGGALVYSPGRASDVLGL